MAIIQNIPIEFVQDHVNWHSYPGYMDKKGRRVIPWPEGSAEPAKGSGREFLEWYHTYLEKFYSWVQDLPENERPQPESIAPWTEIPFAMKTSMLDWNAQLAAEEEKTRRLGAFATLDDLGIFIEWKFNGWLHKTAALLWNEPILISLESPRSTYFWQLHGLFDHWMKQWQGMHF